MVNIAQQGLIPSKVDAFVYRHRNQRQDRIFPLGFQLAGAGTAGSSRSALSSLTTALEWIAEDREQRSKANNSTTKNIPYQSITWIDPSSSSSSPSDLLASRISNESRSGEWIMPLYPLEATYLPSGTNHTLNNVEPRNIQMALDLLQDQDENDGDGNGAPVRSFCAVLRAVDTGRITSLGTILRILEARPQYNENDDIVRIQLHCCTEKDVLVEVMGIENPKAASRESRLRKSPEYLRARVRPIRFNDIGTAETIDFTTNDSKDGEQQEQQQMINQLSRDWDLVKTMYSLGIGSQQLLPPDSLTKLAMGIPDWRVLTSSNDGISSFWKIAEAWQSICYTIREGQRQYWLAERNEQMVAASIAQGGPLKLPIHLEDLPPVVRQNLQQLDCQAQERFWDRGLDPCLDFYILLTLPTMNDRISFLAGLVARERSKLEELARDYTSTTKSVEEEVYDDDEDELDGLPPPPRRGAWFE